MDLFDWGTVNFINNDTEAIVNKPNSSATYLTQFNGRKMSVEYHNFGVKLVSFIDELLDINNLGPFMRKISNQILYFKDSKLNLRFKPYEFKLIEKLLPKGYFNNKIITLDLETVNINGNLIPYAASYYDGKDTKAFYSNDYSDHNEMLKACIQSIMIRKYNGFKVYIHNFSKFDGIFYLIFLMNSVMI